MTVGVEDNSVYYDYYEEYRESTISNDPYVNQKMLKNHLTILARTREILRV